MESTTTPTTGIPDHPGNGGDFGTGLEAGAVEAIKRGYRALREAVYQALKEGTGEAIIASARIDAIVPLMEALTGRNRNQLLRSALNRLIQDNRIESRQFAGSAILVLK